jgi:serine/threonine-protein kinase
MAAPQVRLPPPTTSQGAPRELPQDLLRQATRRLGILSLLAAALWVSGVGLARLAFRTMRPGDARWAAFHSSDVIAAAAVLIALALFFYTRKPDRDPHTALNLGLGNLLFTAFALGAMMHWFPVEVGPIEPMISWVGVVIVFYAAIIPTTPRKMLLVGLIAATMNPVTMLIGHARGVADIGGWSSVLLMHHPDYLLVGVAVVIAHVVTGLGEAVSRAREMGSYQLGSLLGRGGMGEVYRATHRMLARPAAIKLINPETLQAKNGEAADMAVKRFRREAEAAASLRSPHTVELYDFGVTEDQTMYFVMELLDGMDLESFVREYGPLPATRVIHILRQVCESLEEAHAGGMVHRDIKPANIHLGRLGLRHDFVKVLDFGLVKPVGVKPDERTLATASGLAIGTPAYMAPEMALGEAVDGRADIYALGCVAYFLLTGKLVFEGETYLQITVKHLQNDPVPPSKRTSNPIPPALDRVVLACLAKQPNDRPSSAGELSRELAAIDVEPWGEDDARRWWEANRPRDTVTAPAE